MIEYVVAFLALVYGFIVVRDFHKFIKRSHEAIDRDQRMLDSIVEVPVTDHVEDDSPQFAIDMSLDERDAVIQFVEQFREIRKHYGMD